MASPNLVTPTQSAEPLEVTRRLLGSSAIVSVNPGRDIAVALDVEGFIRRLLLFDTYVLYSVRLKEIPEMVRHFGFEAVIALLSSGALEIRCECAQFSEGMLDGTKLPLLTFQFHVLEAHIWEQYLIDSLPELTRSPALNSRELMRLREAVVRAVRRGDNRQMFASYVAPAFQGDILHNELLLKAAVSFVLSKYHGISNVNFAVKLHQIGDDRYEAETNLHEHVRLSPEEIHNTIRSAVLGIAALVQRIGEMNAHVALSGFSEKELPLFSTKLQSLATALGSETQEEQFKRVISISGIPGIAPADKIDMEKLLKIRGEPDAIEFRRWLSEADKLSDCEIKDLTQSFNAKLGLAVQTNIGKAVRFLVTAGIGFLHPPSSVAIGVGLSALDYFIWDAFFKRSKVAAFVHELYPSMFEPDVR